MLRFIVFFIFFFTPPASTTIYTLSLHDALPILGRLLLLLAAGDDGVGLLLRLWFDARQRLELAQLRLGGRALDRKSTRLNSSHVRISYAVSCLKKKTRRSDAN